MIKLQNIFLGLLPSLEADDFNIDSKNGGDNDDIDGKSLSGDEDVDGIPLDGAALLKSAKKGEHFFLNMIVLFKEFMKHL